MSLPSVEDIKKKLQESLNNLYEHMCAIMNDRLTNLQFIGMIKESDLDSESVLSRRSVRNVVCRVQDALEEKGIVCDFNLIFPIYDDDFVIYYTVDEESLGEKEDSCTEYILNGLSKISGTQEPQEPQDSVKILDYILPDAVEYYF